MPYDASFLPGGDVAPPRSPPRRSSEVLDYVHFSLVMNPARRLAWWVAWHIDGTRLFPDIPREDDFFLETRIPAEQQTGEEVYADNDLDRGHLARRSDLLWGSYEEAREANRDSFCFTNISPQRNDFNQSGLGGVWGELENAVLDLEGLVQRRVTVFAGPVLVETDPPYRDLVQLPVDHWKVVVYRIGEQTRYRCFVLTQDLGGLEAAPPYLEEFAPYQITLAELVERTGLAFPGLEGLEETTALVEPDPASRRVSDVTAVGW